MSPKHRFVPALLLAATLAAGLGLGACASKETVSRSQHDELMQAVENYNKNIRWKRPERAAPFVVPATAETYRDWSEEFSEDVDVQDWRIRQYEYEGPITAIVEIERTQYEVRKLVQKKERVDQKWVYDEELGWRLAEGF